MASPRKLKDVGRRDALFELACQMAERDGSASASGFQTELQVGYGRGRKLLRQLQDANFVTKVSPTRGPHKGRCIVIPKTPPHCMDTPRFIPDISIPLLTPERESGKVIPVLFDLHIPHEDQRAMQIVLSILDSEKWDGLILGGDFMSLGQIGPYRVTHPETVVQLQADFDHGAGVLKLLKDVTPNLTAADRIYIPGNHEFRLAKHLLDYSPASTTLRSNRLSEQLRLKENGWSLLYDPIEDVPKRSKQMMLTETFMLTHGAREDGCKFSSISAYAARANLQRWGCSGVSGHTHRFGVHLVTTKLGELIWVEGGHLSNTQKLHWAEVPNWQAGFVILYIGKYKVDVQLLRMPEYEARFRRRVYRA